MRDPHVKSLIYKITYDEKGVSYNDPPALEEEWDAFRVRLDGGKAVVDMKEHHADEGCARSVVEPFLRAWEVYTDLTLSRGNLGFEFVRSQIVDRDPPKKGESQVMAAEPGHYVHAGKPVTGHITRREYPAPPSAFRLTPEVKMLWPQYQAFLDGHRSLSHIAGFFVSVLEDQFKGAHKRRDAAKHYNIEYDVIDKLAELAATRGGSEARKRTGTVKEFSPAEETWIRTTIRKLIRRAGDDLDPLPAKITMADLPELS